MVGVGAAKALAIATGKPLYAVNHLVGHVGADLLRRAGRASEPSSSCRPSRCWSPAATPPCCSSATSRTTSSCSARRSTTPRGRPSTRSPACSGCPIPGGPQIDRAAIGGDPHAIRFPRGLTAPKDLDRHRYDFSFSGLKTAVARRVEGARDRGEDLPIADVAAGFREAVADVLIGKALAACRDLGVPRLLLGGGVVANARIRELAAERAAAEGVALRIPPLELCTDNGAMIAALGARLVSEGRAPSDLGFGADSTLPVTVVQA